MNYFDSKETALRYANSRPPFHENTIQKVRALVGFTTLFNNALDIACGTGLSTETLLPISLKVTGTDASPEMLKHAKRKDKIDYQIAQAEKQPFGDEEFDLINVCSGLHWFNYEKFMQEASRLLTTNGLLVIYDNFFISEIEGIHRFEKWFTESYQAKYPAPARNTNFNWTEKFLQQLNFKIEFEEEFKNKVNFTKMELINYFTTHSNITAAIDTGKTTYQEVEKWLYTELSGFGLNDDIAYTINFGNWLKILKKKHP